MPNENAAISEDLKAKFPTIPKKYHIIDLLLRNPDGVPFEEIAQFAGCNKIAVYSIMKRIRQHRTVNYSVQVLNRKAKIKVSRKNPTEDDIHKNIEEMENYSISKIRRQKVIKTENLTYDKLAAVLIKYPDGIAMNQLAEMLGSTKQSVYNAIHQLREKGYKIISVNGVYKTIHIPKEFQNMTENNLSTETRQSSLIINFKEKQTLPKGYIERIRNLPEHDRIDTYDMIKKSIYYQKSAMALIEANEAIIQLNDEIMKGNLL